MGTIDVRPAAGERWPDALAVMGTRGDPSRCWCQYYHLRGKAWSEATPASNRERFREQMEHFTIAPGVLAYLDGAPVGWCQVGPKSDFPRLAASKASAPPADEPDPPGLWSIACFVVPPPFRRRGVAGALLAGARDHAVGHGASALEGYPVDTTVNPSVGSAGLFHGSLGLFENAGFTEVRRPTPARVVVHAAAP